MSLLNQGPPPEREFRCGSCGRVDTYRLPRFSIIKPRCCEQPMLAGSVLSRHAVLAKLKMDIIGDKRERWRLEPGARERRESILANHPDWTDLHQVWQRGKGRLLGSELVGMVGRVQNGWEYDLGIGISDAKRTGTATSRHGALAAMIHALGG
ncbi:MAG: hypothetical protein ABIE42_09110 [Candidatus Eisenbacteria bacterium]